MPLLLSVHPTADTNFGLWQIQEDLDFFRVDLPLSEQEENDLSKYKGIRQLEWLAARWILHKISGNPQRMPLEKSEFSKPFFPDNATLTCSLSHSHGIVGALIHQRNETDKIATCGCDIQVLVDKITRIAHKFITDPEWELMKAFGLENQFELIHLIWTAKEAMYKGYGLKSLDFRSEMWIEHITWNGHEAGAKGVIRKGNYHQSFNIVSKLVSLDQNERLLWTICLPI